MTPNPIPVPSAPGTSVQGSPYGGATTLDQLPGLLTVPGGVGGGTAANSGPTLQVWIPGTPGKPSSHTVNLGREGNVTVPGTTGGTPGHFGDPDTAKLIPYSWSSKETADFIAQANALGYKVKTFADATNLWSALVDEASKYGAVGREISPYDVMKMHAGDNAAAQAKQAPAPIGRTTAEAAGNSAAQNLLGRDLTDQEVTSVQSAMQAANSGTTNNDLGQAAIDYIKHAHGTEVGSNSALNYYDLILASIGMSPNLAAIPNAPAT